MSQKEISEDLALEWQYQMMLLLKSSLAKHGVSETTAYDVVSDFAFDFAMLHDQGYISIDGRDYQPVIIFSEEEEDQDFDLHDSVFGNADAAFGRD